MNKTKKDKKMITKIIKNYEMSPEVYKLRRQVINLIYKAKNAGVNLPRIDVRIGSANKGHDNVLGVGRLSKNQIWITERAISKSQNYLAHVVYHEIGHAVFGLEHDEKCPLMKSIIDKPVTMKQALSILKKYAQVQDKLVA
tara:strand:- start:238 stop:660 length:423 start_codon:yes stop_codon:yes gene_type:complete